MTWDFHEKLSLLHCTVLTSIPNHCHIGTYGLMELGRLRVRYRVSGILSI